MTLAILVLAVMPEAAQLNRVSVIERNSVYDESGEKRLEQVIWWQWNGKRYECRGWQQAASVQVTASRGGWLSVWEWRNRRRVAWAPHLMETHTRYDPEVADREKLPCEDRRAWK